MEHFIHLFIDSLTAAIILPLRTESVVEIMASFPEYNKYLIYTTALLASMLGSLINYYIGRFIGALRHSSLYTIDKKNWQNIRKFSSYLIWLLLFSWVDFFGNLFTLFAGFIKINLALFLILLFLGKAVYYLVILL
jgi:membrane protein YqaA with SNARE-associated domain